MSSAIKLNLLGQSIWYDNVERALITDGTLKKMIEKREIYGVTSNPSIFQNAIANSEDYNDDLQSMSWAGLSSQEMFYRLAIQDIQDVADLFRPYYEASGGKDGFVSLEVNPNLAHDTQGTINEVLWLWEAVDRPNLMVKIPATKEGLPAITEAIAAGINVNVTLIFSIKRYAAVMNAYLYGLENRLAMGKDLSQVASVASFFVSRLETKADQRLQKIVESGGETADRAKKLMGKIAVDNTRLAYRLYEEYFNSKRFEKLAAAGAQKQRPLWASTSTKNDAYSDIKYVSELVAENTVNTIPPETLIAFLDHGDPEITIYEDLESAEADFQSLSELGISIDDITQELEDEGVAKFAESFNSLLATIENRREKFKTELGSLVSEVVIQVKELEAADVVGRLYRNDPTLWTDSPEGKAEIQKRLGWLRLPDESESLIITLEKFADDCKRDGLGKVLLLGMGGSSLAPETLSLILGKQSDGLDLLILDSTVPEQVKAAEDWVDYQKTLFVVASKSGSTSETMAMFDYYWARAGSVLGEKRRSHFIAITDPGSKLAELGESSGFRAVFTANPNIGGRYSALTHFGLVPAALMGIDLNQLLKRAQDALDVCSNQDYPLNLGLLLGVLLGVGEKVGKNKLTFLTDQAIAPMGSWLEQLVAESSGKDGRGIIPIAGEPQMAPEMYGQDRLFVYLRLNGELDAFVKALQQQKQTTVILSVPNTYSLGSQFYLWEFAVAVACSVIGVNAFDQPDVQDSKNRTKEKIDTFLNKGALDTPDVIWEKDGILVYGREFEGLQSCSTLSEVIARFAALSEDGDYFAINAYLPRYDKIESDLNHLRKQMIAKTGLATTLGFGPRFLHSTGQLHKGGANNGLFLQITQTDVNDLEIPGKGFGFATLAEAQAQGDLEALLSRDRRAIRIHLPAGHSLKFELE